MCAFEGFLRPFLPMFFFFKTVNCEEKIFVSSHGELDKCYGHDAKAKKVVATRMSHAWVVV